MHAVERREENKGEVPLVRVTDWEPVEISLVAIAADPDARIRSEERMPAPRSTTHTDIARARMRMRSAMAAAR